MNLNPPKTVTFVISAIAIVLGILVHPEVALIAGSENLAFWLLAGGGVLLSLGVLVKGL